MTADLWINGDAPIVKVSGRGSLHLISISESGNRPHLKGHVATKEEYTEFLVGYSHFYHNFIFYWDGRGEATCETRSSAKKYLLGNMDDAVQVNRDGVFSRVIVKELNSPMTALKLETTLYIKYAGPKERPGERGSGIVTYGGGMRGSGIVMQSMPMQSMPMQSVPMQPVTFMNYPYSN